MAGFSQKQVALMIGVSCPTVSEWESGKKTPAGKNLIELSRLLSCSTDYLLGVSDHPTPSNEKSPAANEGDGVESELRELKSIWDQLDSDARREVLKYAKYQKSGQDQ